MSTEQRTELYVESFFQRFYDSKAWWKRTFWRGVPVLKCPLDLWLLQQLIYQVRPQLIVELGTFCGGSALYMADLLQILGNGGRVVTVDKMLPETPPEHPLIEYVSGNSVDDDVVRHVYTRKPDGPVMVIADSDHHVSHVYAELKSYHELVTVGSYFIVEDTIAVYPEGPLEAITLFSREHPNFRPDEECHQYLCTFNLQGYLRKISDGQV